MAKYYISMRVKASFVANDENELGLMMERMEDGILGVFGVDGVESIDTYDVEDIPQEEGWLNL